VVSSVMEKNSSDLLQEAVTNGDITVIRRAIEYGAEQTLTCEMSRGTRCCILQSVDILIFLKN
jgi:hypothetical protein